MKIKRGLVVLSCLVMLLAVSTVVRASTIAVVVNGQALNFDQPPVMENGRALVPLRAIFEALGAEVGWDSDTQTVTAMKDDIVITLQIGSNILYKNEEKITLDVPAKTEGGRTLVPTRAVAESFGASVGWFESTQTVAITTAETTLKVELEDAPKPPQEPTGLKLSAATQSLEVGKSASLTATITPADADNRVVTWTSSNTAVATVSEAGVVKGVAAGSATITASTANGMRSTCSVEVTEATFGPFVLNHEYGPMTITNYYHNGNVMNSNNVSSFVITKVDPPVSNTSDRIRVHISLQGVVDYDYCHIYVRFYDANNRVIGNEYIIEGVKPNVAYNLLATPLWEIATIENAVRIEFFSSDGDAAVMSSSTNSTLPIDSSTNPGASGDATTAGIRLRDLNSAAFSHIGSANTSMGYGVFHNIPTGGSFDDHIRNLKTTLQSMIIICDEFAEYAEIKRIAQDMIEAIDEIAEIRVLRELQAAFGDGLFRIWVDEFNPAFNAALPPQR